MIVEDVSTHDAFDNEPRGATPEPPEQAGDIPSSPDVVFNTTQVTAEQQIHSLLMQMSSVLTGKFRVSEEAMNFMYQSSVRKSIN